ncbi:FliM/FliN family flagellar motor switch protein [Erwinia sorbitola]|nr:FliM/FliN family flagellar motor switch protein [Erwinia sorbitola]
MQRPQELTRLRGWRKDGVIIYWNNIMRHSCSQVKIYHSGHHPEMMKLEVNKLGRPYHKIPKIFNDMHDSLDAKLNTYFLKKYRVNAALKTMSFEMDAWQKQTKILSSDIGSLAFDIERGLLLNVLHDYYGLNKERQENISSENAPVTKTEERLKNKLAQELVALITGEGLFGKELQIKSDPASLITQWSYRINFTLEGYEGGFSLLLDNAHVDRLLVNLRQQTESSAISHPEKPVAGLQTSFMTLPVHLTGRLVSIPLTVAELLEIKTGDILPMTPCDRIPLFIGKQPLFNAVIAEDHGKLFFSEFRELNTEKSYD